MYKNLFIPETAKDAGTHIRRAFANPLDRLPKPDFIRAWASIAYLFPGLHPDGFEDAESGWPRVLHRFAGEAWRRASAGELAEEELYCCDAQWAGLYDAMEDHTPEETHRRLGLKAVCIQGSNG